MTGSKDPGKLKRALICAHYVYPVFVEYWLKFAGRSQRVARSHHSDRSTQSEKHSQWRVTTRSPETSVNTSKSKDTKKMKKHSELTEI